MAKLSPAQKNLLITLSHDLPYGRPYLQNQFKNHVLDACVRKGLIEVYPYRRYLYEAVTLTQEGKRVLGELLKGNDSLKRNSPIVK